MNNKHGFSLIELMIVIAIIGILASIGIPAYGDYMVRSRVTELVSAADGIKAILQENATFNSGFTKATNLAAIDAPDPSGTGMLSKALLSENTETDVYLHMCGYESKLGITGAGNYLGIVFKGTYSANGGVTWECQYKANPSTFSKYVPASCKTPTTSTNTICATVD